MDAELKNTFEQVCCELGLTPTEAFTLFATKVARERRIPFAVVIDPFYSTENLARLRKSITQMEATIGVLSTMVLKTHSEMPNLDQKNFLLGQCYQAFWAFFSSKRKLLIRITESKRLRRYP